MFRSSQRIVFLFALFALVSTSAWAASTKDEVRALQEEIKSMKENQAAMQKDLTKIRKLLESGARPTAAAVQPKAFEERNLSIGPSPFLGQPDAPITLVEFSDYQCPFCRRHYINTHGELVKNYVDTGKIRIVMKEFPLTSIHPRALPASLAALCAGDQGKYWEMHNLLFENQKSLSNEDLLDYGKQLGLETDRFTDCFTDGTYAERVDNDMNDGKEFGVRGTPSFVMGITDTDNPDQVLISKFFSGARSYESLSKEIDAMLEATPD